MKKELKIEDNKNLIIIFIIIIILLLGSIIYMIINRDKKVNDTYNEYENYTNADLSVLGNEKMNIKISNGKLVATIKKKQLKIKGIEGDVKSFTYGNDCNGVFTILVITTNNKLYVFEYSTNAHYDDNRKLVQFNEKSTMNFKEIKTSENIINITKRMEISTETCKDHYIAVVLDNRQIKPLYKDDTYKIGSLDYSKFMAKIGSLILYKDNTISELYTDKFNGTIKEKLKYQDKELFIDKIITVYNNKYETYYFVSNKKIYKLDNNSIILLSENKIKNESLNVTYGYNIFVDTTSNNYDLNKTKNDTFTFVNGDKLELKNITMIYSTK